LNLFGFSFSYSVPDLHHDTNRRKEDSCMPDIPISYPGRYAPGVAVNFSDGDGNARQVSATSPLPVTLSAAATGSGTTPPPPLAGTTSATTTLGPFTPVADKPMILTLTGTWAGSVQLLRSIDGGTTRLPLSLAGTPWGIYTGPVCEPVWEETEAGARFYLKFAPTSGAVTYRLAQ
jgi:hypothetical protein